MTDTMNQKTGLAVTDNLRDLDGQQLRRSARMLLEKTADPEVVQFSFSSEAPVTRYWGIERLSHGAGAADFSRVDSGSAPWIWHHDANVILGKPLRAWISGGKGYVEARWSPVTKIEGTAEYNRRLEIESGVVPSVSFGYEIDPGSIEDRSGELWVMRWTVVEISSEPIPADATVGVGRTLAASPTLDTEVPTSPQTQGAIDPPGPETMADESINLDEVRAQAAADERTRVSSITSLCREHGVDISQELIERGVVVADAQSQVLAELAKRAKAPKQNATPAAAGVAPMPINGNGGDIGLSEREVQDYSFVRIINAAANPTDRAAQQAAAFEIEASAAAASKRGKAARGFVVPQDVLRRDLLAGTASAGGNMIGGDFRPGSFIELLRNQMVLNQVGITTLSGLTGPVAIPKQTASGTAYWVSEGGAPTESQQTIEQINMTPKTVAAFTDFSRRLTIQSSLDVEQFVRNDLSRVLALELDRVGLYGLGNTNQPQGVRYVTGINTEDFSNDAPTYTELVSMESKVADDNADIGSMAYITTPLRLGGMKTTEKASNTAQFVYEPGGTVNGYPIYRSKQVIANDVWFGVWSQLVLGLFSGLDIMVDPYTGSTSGTVRVIAMQDADYAVRYAEAFTRGNNSL